MQTSEIGVVATFKIPLAQYQRVLEVAQRDGVAQGNRRGDVSAAFRHVVAQGLAAASDGQQAEKSQTAEVRT